MAALTKSPAHGRRSSSGSGGLRPIMPFDLNNGGTAVDDDDDQEELGPMPKEPGPFHSGGGVDEVEYAYGYVEVSCLNGEAGTLTEAQCMTEAEDPERTLDGYPYAVYSWSCS